MRREVLYQYDLPIEILDAIPAEEEVLTVLFGRSKEKNLIPILFSDTRILWGYPERDTVYKVFELHYIELVSASAKFTAASAPSLTLQTTTRTILFPTIQETVEEVRAALLTLTDQMKLRTSTQWEIVYQKNLLTDEYSIKNNPDKPYPVLADDELFEETIRNTKPLDTTPHETLFTHFAKEGEDDVFEGEERETDQSSALEHKISRMVEAVDKPAETTPASKPENDAVIYESAGLATNDQWHEEVVGDAEILPRGRPWKAAPAQKSSPSPPREVFSPEDDDSEVYTASSSHKLVVPKPKAEAVIPSATHTADTIEVVETVEILPPAIPLKKRKKEPAEPRKLQPKVGIDEATIDKSLDALKFLRDNNIISEAEYKKRSLSLFENGEEKSD